MPGAVIGQSAIKGACPYSCNRFATELVTPEPRLAPRVHLRTTKKAGSITGPASFIYLYEDDLLPHIWLFPRLWAAFTGWVVSQGYLTRTADTGATIASTAFSISHSHRGADRILRKILIFHLDLLAIECLMEHFVSFRDPQI